MPTDAVARISCVQLDWADKNGVVTVTPRDESRFAIQMHRAVEALQRADKEDQFQRQFKLLWQVVAQWLLGRQDIADAHLTLRDGRIALIIIRTSDEYDELFEDELSELDLDIANDADLDLISLDAIALPSTSEDALSSFLDPNFDLVFAYGQRG